MLSTCLSLSGTTPIRLSAIAACAVSGVSCNLAIAQEVIEDLKLTAPDGAAGDRFGGSVAITGNTAIVGSRLDDDNGINSGSAYLFDVITGNLIAKLTASDGATNDRLGKSVAIDGTTAIVGAEWDEDNGIGTGSAYLFDITTGSQIAKLTASDGAPYDNFGGSVAISGTTAIVGSRFDEDNGIASGSAYLFDVTTGNQIAKLTGSDTVALDSFGISVAISGTTAIVGSLGDDDNGDGSGSAYLFDATTGIQIAKLTASDGAAGDNFGVSVAISGTTAIVGSFGDDDNAISSGSAYLFDITTGNQIAKLTASDGEKGDNFGISVAVSGTTAIVGSRFDDESTNPGSAYLFDVTTGNQIAKLTASDGAAGDDFGRSVAISGTTAIVGSRYDDDNGNGSGSAYLFNVTLPCNAADIAPPLGVLDLADITVFVTGFSNADPVSDFNGDSVYDLADITAFVVPFAAGCP